MIELKGYSYPFATLAQVIAAEAHWGRKVSVVIEHAGGWAVSEAAEYLTCDCFEDYDKDCPIHGGK